MFKKSIKNRMFAVVLTGLMAVSMTGYSFADAFALENNGEAAADQNLDREQEETDGGQKSYEDEGAEIVPEPEPLIKAAETAPAGTVDVKASGDEWASGESLITAVWKAVSGADYYIVYLDEDLSGKRVDSESPLKCVLKTDNNRSIRHRVTVKAYKTAREGQPEDTLISEGRAEDISAVIRSRLSGKPSRNPVRNLGINLKTLLGEKWTGYSVVQGGCTDGTYAYYLMVSPTSQHGKILKTYVGSGSVVKRSGVVDIDHGNGMTMDTKNNRLVVVGRAGRRNELTTIDANNLSTVKHYNVNYSYPGAWNTDYRRARGLSAISYIPEYDVYVAMQRNTHDLLVLDQQFRCIAMIEAVIKKDYPGTYQAMDADEKYVYILLSRYTDAPSKQPYNRILVLDWNSENLLDYVNGSVNCIEDMWRCNNDGSGKPDSVIRIKTSYEAENIYHIDNGDGTAHFWLSEYYNHPKYKTVTKKKAYRKKWKKVKKRVKWKKVRIKKGKNKGKYKWKYKTKKVWKYKKKYKKVKVKAFSHFNREGYVYDLGTF